MSWAEVAVSGGKMMEEVYDSVANDERKTRIVGSAIGPVVGAAVSAATLNPLVGGAATAATNMALESNTDLKRGVAGGVASVASAVGVGVAAALLSPLVPFFLVWAALSDSDSAKQVRGDE